MENIRRFRHPTRMPKHAATVWPGQPYPLGATWDGEGINFALFSEQAERVGLCLFDRCGRDRILDPPHSPYAPWQVLVDTAFPGGHRGDGRNFHSGERYPLQARSMSLLGQMKSKSAGPLFA